MIPWLYGPVGRPVGPALTAGLIDVRKSFLFHDSLTA
jgi:hypothetical protein